MRIIYNIPKIKDAIGRLNTTVVELSVFKELATLEIMNRGLYEGMKDDIIESMEVQLETIKKLIEELK